MCNCYEAIKEKLVEQARSKAPAGAVDISVDFGGYVFGLIGNGVTHRSANEITVRYQAPKKAGGLKKVTNKFKLFASHCPYCGEKYGPAEGGAE
jgi:hypothetical protein